MFAARHMLQVAIRVRLSLESYSAVHSRRAVDSSAQKCMHKCDLTLGLAAQIPASKRMPRQLRNPRVQLRSTSSS